MKLKKITLFALICICLTSCFKTNKGVPEHYDIVYVDEKIDKDALDNYFTNNIDSYPSYQTLKENSPDLLDHVKVIKTTGLYNKGNITMFRFSETNNGFLNNETFILEKAYNGSFYTQLGGAFGGHGVTDFIRRQGDAGHWIYYLYSNGSGIHRTYIGAYERGKHQLYKFNDVNLPMNQDFVMDVDEQGNIDVYQATITPYYDDDGFALFDIVKGNLEIDNVDSYKLTKI